MTVFESCRMYFLYFIFWHIGFSLTIFFSLFGYYWALHVRHIRTVLSIIITFFIQFRSHLHFCTHFYIFTHNLLCSVNIYTYICTDFMKLALSIETNVRGKGFLYIISELKNKSQSISQKSNHSGSQGVKHCDMSFLSTNKHKYSSDHERTAFSVWPPPEADQL